MRKNTEFRGLRVESVTPGRALSTGWPALIVGSIALTLAAPPAHAVEASQDSAPMQRIGGTKGVDGVASALRAPGSAVVSTHTVQPGETVTAIAARYGLRTVDVLTLNGLTWQSIIYPGQVLALAGAPAPAPAAPAAPAAGGYTIVTGDTISAIASRHGVTTDALLSANALTRASIIYPGQTLAIPGAAPAAAPAPSAAPASSALDAEQAANAQLIIRIGRELGVSDRGIAIALGTAMQESWLRNLDGGDRDSLGLFQQRPSTGWGSADQVRDADRSTRAFYGGASDPNGSLTRGLLDIPGWESMTYADAAQAVQISAHPDRYAQWEQPSYAWLAALR